MAGQEEENYLHCSCTIGITCDKIHHARAIIEQEYLNPPSLHQLALRVGTNECTLKRGFKTVFGTTVFGHIFEYRMKMACRYLLTAVRRYRRLGRVSVMNIMLILYCFQAKVRTYSFGIQM